MEVSKYNKATAATVAGAIAVICANYVPSITQEVGSALQALLTVVLVYAIPNLQK